MKTCCLEGCNNRHVAMDYCGLHYKRLQRHGDATVVKEGHRFEVGNKPRYAWRRKSVHGQSLTPAYVSWKSMNTRCRNPNAANYPRYGGSGVKICNSWKSFENFLKDMGPRPVGTSLDRIDSKGNYEPSNCRWADFKTQARNSGRSPLPAMI